MMVFYFITPPRDERQSSPLQDVIGESKISEPILKIILSDFSNDSAGH